MKKLFAVIGDPIAHSSSPFMHTLWLKQKKIEASYVPFHVLPYQLEEVIQSFRLLKLSGWNVTIPHKETIIPFLDELDESARIAKAVNTVVVQNEKLIGYNTDGMGLITSIEKQGIALSNQSNVLLIGAGGAAKGIAAALIHQKQCHVTMTNRSIERAVAVQSELPTLKVLSMEDAENELAMFDILIQTTPLGMEGMSSHSPISLHNLSSSSAVVDIIYTPLETTFLKEANEKGAKTINGLGMFVYQGAHAFELWNNEWPDCDIAFQQMEVKLGGSSC